MHINKEYFWENSVFHSNLLPTGFEGIFPLGMKLTLHLHLVSKLRMYGALPPFFCMPSWCGA